MGLILCGYLFFYYKQVVPMGLNQLRSACPAFSGSEMFVEKHKF